MIGILAELAVRPALPQQIPALVQSVLHRTQPITLLRAGQLAPTVSRAVGATMVAAAALIEVIYG